MIEDSIPYYLPKKEAATFGYIYFLYLNSYLVYIGKTINLESRIRAHMLNVHFTSVYSKRVSLEQLHSEEARLINEYTPPFNSCRNPEKYRFDNDTIYCKSEKKAYPVKNGLFSGNDIQTFGFCSKDRLILIEPSKWRWEWNVTIYDFSSTQRRKPISINRDEVYGFGVEDNGELKVYKTRKELLERKTQNNKNIYHKI